MQTIFAQFASDTRLLEPSKGNGGVEHIVTVDPDCPSFQFVGRIERSVDIFAEDGGCEAVD